jgi:hypothetical protein
MNGSLLMPSLATGTATLTLLATFSTRLVFSLLSTRWARRASQAALRTSMTPSSETQESSRRLTLSAVRIESSMALRAGSRSAGRITSILLQTMNVGLLVKRGLMDS